MDITNGHNPECPTCVHHQFDFLDRSSHHQVVFSTLCGRDTVQINPRNGGEINMSETAQRLKKNGKVSGNPYLLRFFPNNEITMVLFKDGRVLIHGTNDTVKAKSYYAKYIGS
jgi:hypothetical protein